jgi:hypothetical protein
MVSIRHIVAKSGRSFTAKRGATTADRANQPFDHVGDPGPFHQQTPPLALPRVGHHNRGSSRRAAFCARSKHPLAVRYYEYGQLEYGGLPVQWTLSGPEGEWGNSLGQCGFRRNFSIVLEVLPDVKLLIDPRVRWWRYFALLVRVRSRCL